MKSTRGTRWRNLFALCLTRIKDDENNCCNFSLCAAFVVLRPLLYSQPKMLFALFSLEEEEKEEVAES